MFCTTEAIVRNEVTTEEAGRKVGDAKVRSTNRTCPTIHEHIRLPKIHWEQQLVGDSNYFVTPGLEFRRILKYDFGIKLV